MRNTLLSVSWVTVLAAFMILIGFSHLGVVVAYSVPNAEDFAMSIAPSEVGKVTSAVELLIFLDSRFTANMMHGFNVLTVGMYKQFWVMPFLTLICLWQAVRFFLASLFRPRDDGFRLHAAAAVFVFAFYAIAPSLSYGLTYMSSTFTYIWPAILWFLWSGCLLRSFAARGFRHVVLSFIGLACLVCSYGCSELFILLNPMSLVLFILVAPNGWRRHLPDVIPYAVVSVATLMFILNCPSNRFSEENIIADLATRYPDTNFALHSLKVFLTTLVETLFCPLTLLSILVFSCLIPERSLRDTVRRSVQGGGLNAFFFLWQGMAYAVALGYYLPRGSIGEYPEYDTRALNVVMLVSFTGIMVYSAGSGLRRSMARIFNGQRVVHALTLMSLILLCLVFPGDNYLMIRKELLHGTLALNWESHQQFYEDANSMVEEGKRPSVVLFAMPETVPFSIFPERDLLPNRENEDWNIAYELYFGVDEVRLPGDTVFKR